MIAKFSNIHFFGGIHGVGKSTLCKTLCSTLNIEYLSASDVLKWAEINASKSDKRVENVHITQNRLVDGLLTIFEPTKKYLLDGHYCLLDKENNIVRVPFDTFSHINPISLNIIVGDVSEIKKRLDSRDQQNYALDLLEKMQSYEIKYAEELSKKMNVPLNFGTHDNFENILSALSTFLR